MDCDDFENDGDLDDDSFEDACDDDFEMEDPAENDLESEDETTKDDCCEDEFTIKDAAIIGGAFGWGYEEGLRERKRRKRIRDSDDEPD